MCHLFGQRTLNHLAIIALPHKNQFYNIMLSLRSDFSQINILYTSKDIGCLVVSKNIRPHPWLLWSAVSHSHCQGGPKEPKRVVDAVRTPLALPSEASVMSATSLVRMVEG